MTNIPIKTALSLIFGLILLASCNHSDKKKTSAASAIDYSTVASPTFCADSAYQYVADQVAFGPRIPGSTAQSQCANYLTRQMKRWCDTVIVQNFSTVLWNGQEAKGKNIIASIESKGNNPTNRRILLAAHWDSRMWADHDPDEANHHTPIDGANDGASGVGVLMEMARCIATKPLDVAVDIIFFDVEDQGVPEWADSYEDDSWCKGSQHWGKNPHIPYYNAVYGILLDMVGTPKPRYTKEQYSRQYASNIMDKTWMAATALGYGGIFNDDETAPILDDHIYVNQLANIPMIDIVQNSRDCSFFKYWHTQGDNMEHVNRQSLNAIGTVLLKTIYGDYLSK